MKSEFIWVAVVFPQILIVIYLWSNLSEIKWNQPFNLNYDWDSIQQSKIINKKKLMGNVNRYVVSSPRGIRK